MYFDQAYGNSFVFKTVDYRIYGMMYQCFYNFKIAFYKEHINNLHRNCYLAMAQLLSEKEMALSN